MATIGPGGDVARDNVGELALLVGSIIRDKERLITAVLALSLLSFAVIALLAELAMGWLVVSATVPICFVAGLAAGKLATRWPHGDS